jgi:hypothetical protein
MLILPYQNENLWRGLIIIILISIEGEKCSRIYSRVTEQDLECDLL